MRQFLGYGAGKDGAKTISGTEVVNVYTSVSGTNTANTTTISVSSTTGFSAGDLILIHKTRGNTTVSSGNWEVNRIVSVGTGSFTLSYPLVFSYNDDGGTNQSQIVRIREYSSLSVPSNTILTAQDWNGDVGGIICVATKTCSVSGKIRINGANGTGGGGINIGGGFRARRSQGQGDSLTGEGDASQGHTQTTANNGSGGGGGAITSGGPGGGGGGNGTAGQGGTGGASGGATSGNTTLSIMNFGGAGGTGGRSVSNDNNRAGGGGNGGGIILLFAKEITISGGGGIEAIGGAGQNGLDEGGGGGGGGAGGSILIKCQSASVGTNLVLAGGGIGGNRWNNPQNKTGGDGGVGRIRIEYGVLFSGTTSPSASVEQISSLIEAGGSSFFYAFL